MHEQYVKEGVGGPAQAELPDLLELKYHAVRDAAAELGSVASIRDVFVGFRQYLYAEKAKRNVVFTDSCACPALTNPVERSGRIRK